jgi:hypothetical protein
MSINRLVEDLSMQCPACSAHNDSDAAFCIECGRPLIMLPNTTPGKPRKTYLFVIALVPMVAIVAAIGYYKFFLPNGIAAIVNGEDIRTSELDAVAVRAPGLDETAYREYRYEALNRLITETLVLQEARKAGLGVSEEELSSATAEASYGQDVAALRRQRKQLYGGKKQYERALKRRILVTKYIHERIIPKGADQQTARAAVNAWLQGLTEKALVRVSLAEQGASYNCCARGGGSAAQGSRFSQCGSGVPPQGSLTQERTKAARDAGLVYWRKKHGRDAVTAKVLDFGCHIQIDILKDNKTVGSLIYQGGNVTEM